MDDLTAKKYMIMSSLAIDWDLPKLTLGKKTCKCELKNYTGVIIFISSSDKPDAAIEDCYKDLLSYLAIKFWE